jgi:hypothetical protein
LHFRYKIIMQAIYLTPKSLKLSELIGSLSYALDITEGPAGRPLRALCWIGMHIGRDAGHVRRSSCGSCITRCC